MSLCVGIADEREEVVGAVTAVSDDMAAAEASRPLRSSPQIVGLPGRESQVAWQAVLVDDSVDLCAQSATRTTDGVISYPRHITWLARKEWLNQTTLEIAQIEPRHLHARPRKRIINRSI
jgi:hypothetical protein